jgi:general secretion pathway protein L
VSVDPVHRLVVFLPGRRTVQQGGNRGAFSAATVAAFGGVNPALQLTSAADAPLSLLPKAASVDLLFDVSDVYSGRIDSPRMSESRLRQALPGLVEEHLLSDAADCHLAFSIDAASRAAAGASMRIAVGAIDRVTLTRGLDAASEAGLRVRHAYSALYSIPSSDGNTLSVRLDRGHGFARTAEHTGVAFDLHGDAPAALALAVRQLQVKRVRVYGRDAAALQQFAPQLGVEVVDTRRALDPESLASGVDLLQGRYAPGGRLGLPTLTALANSRLLKPALTWLAVSLIVFVAGVNAYRWKLESEASGLRESMRGAFLSAFPSESFIQPVPQTRRHLRELRARAGQVSPDDFSVLNAQAAQLLGAAPLGVLAGLEYRDAALTLKFKAPMSNNASLKNALQAQALQQGLSLRFDSDNTARLTPNEP